MAEADSSAPVPIIPFRRVTVCWLDAFSEDGWVDHDDAEVVARHEVVTTGWIIREDVEYVVVAGTVSPDPRRRGNWQVSGAMGIPKGCVLRRIEVE